MSLTTGGAAALHHGAGPPASATSAPGLLIDHLRTLGRWLVGDSWPARAVRLAVAAAAGWFALLVGFVGLLVLRAGLLGGVVMCLFGCPEPSPPSSLRALAGLLTVVVAAAAVVTVFAVAWRPRAAGRVLAGPDRGQALRALFWRSVER